MEQAKKQSLMRFKVIVILGFVFLSCTTYDYYTVASPDGSKCITFEYNTSMIPNDSLFVKLYLGSGQVNKDQYLKMLWSDIGSVDLDWNSKPLIIRSWLLKENTIPSNSVDVRKEMSTLEKHEFHEPGSGWKSYDFAWISDGRYESCE